MLSTDATATPLRRYTAQVIREIVYQGRTYRAGEEITIIGPQVDTLREAGVIGAIRRLAADVETAVVSAPEDASRTYKRRPR